MLDQYCGKLLVYASSFASCESRLGPVSSAAERMAKLLKLNVEVKKLRKRFVPIYVYYKEGGDEPIPIYCNKGEEPSTDEVYAVLKNMMFVLSFHPRLSALKPIRKEVMELS